MFKSTSQLIAIILGVGMVGQNFFVLNMLSKRETDMPNLARLATTENSSSQMKYSRDGEKLDVLVTHNMPSPKTVMFTSEKSKWNGKIDYTHREYIPHVPTEKAQEIDLKCLEAEIIARNNGGLVAAGVAGAAGASKLSSIPIIGFLLEPFARNRAQKIGQNVGGSLGKDLSDC